MMSPEGGAPPAQLHHPAPATALPREAPAARPTGIPAAFRNQLRAVLDGYLELQASLAKDSAEDAREAAEGLSSALARVDMKLLQDQAHQAWMKESAAMANAVRQVIEAADIEAERQAFALLSESLAAALKRFGPVGDKPLFRLTCPMAFNNRGASWLQDTEEVNNPYFGAAMLKCGEVAEVISQGSPAPEEAHHHE
jgi:Cu(I)/Ag(I) efflux system membrane fusion protein